MKHRSRAKAQDFWAMLIVVAFAALVVAVGYCIYDRAAEDLKDRYYQRG